MQLWNSVLTGEQIYGLALIPKLKLAFSAILLNWVNDPHQIVFIVSQLRAGILIRLSHRSASLRLTLSFQVKLLTDLLCEGLKTPDLF